MRKGAKISLVVAGLLALAVLWVMFGRLRATYQPWVMSGCLRATYQHSKVTIGMSVADVFNALDQWYGCASSYKEESTNEFRGFMLSKGPIEDTYLLRSHEDAASKTIGSKEELLQVVGKQMSNGKAWSSHFTYLSGRTRCTFRVDFDRNSKVINVSGMGYRPSRPPLR